MSTNVDRGRAASPEGDNVGDEADTESGDEDTVPDDDDSDGWARQNCEEEKESCADETEIPQDLEAYQKRLGADLEQERLAKRPKGTGTLPASDHVVQGSDGRLGAVAINQPIPAVGGAAAADQMGAGGSVRTPPEDDGWSTDDGEDAEEVRGEPAGANVDVPQAKDKACKDKTCDLVSMFHVVCFLRKKASPFGELHVPCPGGDVELSDLTAATCKTEWARLKWEAVSHEEYDSYMVVCVESLRVNRSRHNLAYTCRELSYRHKRNFSDSKKSGATVERLAAKLGCTREDLGVQAGAKGVAFGELEIDNTLTVRGASVNCSGGITLIPYINPDTTKLKVGEGVDRVIVLESEIAFKNLIRLDVEGKLCSKSILVSGKGFPDKATQYLVAALGRKPGLTLVYVRDPNPFGWVIFLCYRDGPKAAKGRREAQACHSLRLIGVASRELEDLTDPATLERLAAIDERRCDILLTRPAVLETPGFKDEVKHCLHFGFKGEIESLRGPADLNGDYDPAYLFTYVLGKYNDPSTWLAERATPLAD
eukprot:m.419201 g.419201  ORF g.419201 m.419201 type:complete len:539 (-) comp31374_c0_seq1:138-1754(-)